MWCQPIRLENVGSGQTRRSGALYVDPASASALNRFGLGAKPGEIQSVRDPQAWLLEQLEAGGSLPSAMKGLPSSLDYLQRESAYNQERLMERRSRRKNAPQAESTVG